MIAATFPWSLILGGICAGGVLGLVAYGIYLWGRRRHGADELPITRSGWDWLRDQFRRRG